MIILQTINMLLQEKRVVLSAITPPDAADVVNIVHLSKIFSYKNNPFVITIDFIFNNYYNNERINSYNIDANSGYSEI